MHEMTAYEMARLRMAELDAIGRRPHLHEQPTRVHRTRRPRFTFPRTRR